MSSSQQEPNLDSLLDIFTKVGNEEQQIEMLTTMVSDKTIVDCFEVNKEQYMATNLLEGSQHSIQSIC
jgi:hypothetical protein